MSESLAHIHLVNILKDFVSKEFFGGDDGKIFVDSPQNNTQNKAFTINGFRPDLYAKPDNNSVILGEAKTWYDLERDHSLAQFRAFLNYCSGFDNSKFILAVPWDLTIHGQNLLKQIQAENNLHDVEVITIKKIVI